VYVRPRPTEDLLVSAGLGRVTILFVVTSCGLRIDDFTEQPLPGLLDSTDGDPLA
jgi:hypothetical protein